MLWFMKRNIYSVFIPVPGTELLKPLDFPVMRAIKMLFVNLRRLPLGSAEDGAGCQKSQSYDYRLGISSCIPLNFQGGESRWRLNYITNGQWSNQSCLSKKKRKSVLDILWKDWCWSWNSNALATWCEELTFLKRPWCWERLKAGEEGEDRGWDGWMASRTQWTWVWVNSRQELAMDREVWHAESMGSQRIGWRDWTELNWR